MKKLTNSRFFVIAIFFVITIFFFFPVFIKGLVPFPGDLLLAEYQPWRSTSFNNVAPGGIPNKAQYFDTLRQLYPWKTFAISSIKEGSFPLWNPHDFSGSPLFANFQSAILYPLNVFYLIFSQNIAWTILIISQPLLSLFAVYYLSRRYKLSKTASVFASASYAFCLYMTTFLEYNIMGHFMYLLPVCLLWVEQIILKKWWAYILLSLSIAMLAFAGHAQLFAGVVLYVVIYSAIRILQTGKNKHGSWISLLTIFFVIFLGVGISAIQLIPGIELVNQSARSPHNVDFFFNNLLIKPTQLVFYLIPDLFGNPAAKNYLLPFSYPTKALYVGIATIFFFLLSLFTNYKNTYFRAISVLTIFTGLIVFLNPVSFIYKLNLPLISSSSPSNFIFMISLGICIMAGFGIDAFFNTKTRRHYLILLLLWVIIGSTFIATTFTHTQIIKNNLVYSSLILFSLSLVIVLSEIKKIKNILGIAIIILVCLDLLYFFHKFNPFVSPSYIYPPTGIGKYLQKNTSIDRFWGYSYANIESNFPTQLGIYSPNGYDPLFPKVYGEFIQTSKNGIIPSNFNDFTRSDATIQQGFGESDMAENAHRLKVLSALGVKYILDKTENGSTSKTFPPSLFENIAKVNDFNVLLYKKAAPRFFMTTSFAISTNNNDFTDKFFDQNFDASKTIILNENPLTVKVNTPGKTSSRLISYRPNSVVIKTNSEAASLLYLSDTFYPGWKAYVDQNNTKIYNANYTFRAVEVPKGEHLVRFVFQPDSLHYGLYITAISIIVGIVLQTVYLLRNKRYGKKKV